MKKNHIYLFLCFLWMIVIFMFSHQPANTSQSLSNDVIKMLEQILHIEIIKQGGWFFDTISFFVRKAAHMSEYALLAILFSCYFRTCGKRRFLLYAILCVVLYAISDEVHQLFIQGRSGQVSDVCIDAFGGAIGLSLQQLYWYVKRPICKGKHLQTIEI